MKFLRYSLLILLSCAGISGLAQITFYADKVDGCDSLEVMFTFSDFTGTVSTVDWDFGNGETATGLDPQTVLYDTAGTYEVSIKIDGNDFPKKVYIRVHSTPRRGFIWSDSLEIGTFAVVLTGVSQVVDSVNYSYEWILSDGGGGDTRSLIHRFPEAGDYQARLKVTHPFGCETQATRTLTVRDSLDCPNVFTPN